MTLTKNTLKYIRSLKDKKNRDLHETFVAEGDKLVDELLGVLDCEILISTGDFSINSRLERVGQKIEVTDAEIKKASFQKNPQNAIAVFHQPKHTQNYNLAKDLCLGLDGIQDPGNMGTIIRLADWYGIEHIFCSTDSVDVYNPKVVQATMGALARVKVHYLDLLDFLSDNQETPIYGTLLDGESIYEQELSQNGILLMGNEGRGIRPEIENKLNRKIYIPNYPVGNTTSESLNVAIATAIVCAEFRRRLI